MRGNPLGVNNHSSKTEILVSEIWKRVDRIKRPA